MFGRVIVAHRLRCGLSQELLAEKAGLSTRGLRNLESGRIRRPRPTTVRRLAEALGLHGPELEQFSRLAFERTAPAHPTRPAESSHATVPPAQLPADVPGFAGRVEQLVALDALVGGEAQPRRTVPVNVAIYGSAGIGKTALAIHWAHRIAFRFPDGQLYVNLRGFHPDGQAMEVAEAVRGFLDALGAPASRIPPGLDAQLGLYRSLLAGKRLLIVLDNARDADQVRSLLPGTPTAVAVVTSRSQLTGLVAAGAHPLALEVLSVAEARELLIRRLGAERVAEEPTAVDAIINRCARLPLALAVAVARARQTGFALASLAAQLSDVDSRLDALDAGDRTSEIRTVFSWSYTALTPSAAQLFRLLGLHPGPDISIAAAANLVGVALVETRRWLAELASASLVTELAPGRYAFHDLLRVYATDLSHTYDTDDDRRAALGRLLDHYTGTAVAADRLLYPHRDPIGLPLDLAGIGLPTEDFADPQQAMAWLTAEHPALFGAIRVAITNGFDIRVWQLAWAIDTYLARQGHRNDQAFAWQAALDAAVRLDDLAAQAYAHRFLASVDGRLGRQRDAADRLRYALDLYAQANDEVGQAHTRYNLAFLAWRQDDPELAIEQAGQALVLFQAAGHRRGQAFAMNNLGWYNAMRGDYAQTLTYCGPALSILQQLGDRVGEANAWDTLGYAYHHLGREVEAADCYEVALALCRDLDDRILEVEILDHLADVYRAAGRDADARTAWQQASDILGEVDDVDHPAAEAVREKLRALST